MLHWTVTCNKLTCHKLLMTDDKAIMCQNNKILLLDLISACSRHPLPCIWVSGLSQPWLYLSGKVKDAWTDECMDGRAPRPLSLGTFQTVCNISSITFPFLIKPSSHVMHWKSNQILKWIESFKFTATNTFSYFAAFSPPLLKCTDNPLVPFIINLSVCELWVR